jgi:nitroreductase
MDFYDVVRSRRSIRGYKDASIPDEVIERISEAVNLAPSACNMQPWQFRIIFNEELRTKICANYSQPWLKEAPAIVVALGDSENCWKRPQEGTPIVDIDLAIAMEHLVLAAASEGLGTCWICAYDRAKMDKTLDIKPPWSVLAISPLGYPAVPARDIERKDVSETVVVVK